jgi:hypothetical protein
MLSGRREMLYVWNKALLEVDRKLGKKEQYKEGDRMHWEKSCMFVVVVVVFAVIVFLKPLTSWTEWTDPEWKTSCGQLSLALQIFYYI